MESNYFERNFKERINDLTNELEEKCAGLRNLGRNPSEDDYRNLGNFDEVVNGLKCQINVSLNGFLKYNSKMESLRLRECLESFEIYFNLLKKHENFRKDEMKKVDGAFSEYWKSKQFFKDVKKEKRFYITAYVLHAREQLSE